MNRRAVLKAGVVLAATSHTAIATAESSVVDPLVENIKAFKSGWKVFCDTPDAEAESVDHLWRRPFDNLKNWNNGCGTREGAILALKTVVEEEELGDSPISGPLIKAALNYLETLA